MTICKQWEMTCFVTYSNSFEVNYFFLFPVTEHFILSERKSVTVQIGGIVMLNNLLHHVKMFLLKFA